MSLAIYSQTIVEFCNPWALSLPIFVGLFLAKCGALFLLDELVELSMKYIVKPDILPFRKNHPNVKGLEKLAFIDYEFLVINSVIEFIYVNHVAYFAWHSGVISWSTDLDWKLIALQPVASWLIFALDDLFYMVAHWIMHWDVFYKYVHKHHHRQSIPRRGYVDAGNEHPLEQVVGQYLMYAAIQIIATFLVPVHAVTLLVLFVLYAILALLNHTPYDVRFGWLGFQFEVRAHAMHHRYPKCNMAQYFMFWDTLLGTYRPYQGTLSSKKA